MKETALLGTSWFARPTLRQNRAY